ncbi:adenylate kinase [Candidatus Saganbacteria bacterium]|nr:adenylate kinase [Candidatus Saganbacteria bacterium]
MIYVFLGAPGSGKGTQAKQLSARLNIPHIALGDILRESIRLGTEVGRLAKSFVEAGKLVPDEVTIRLTRERVAGKDCSSGFILDGFPRSLEQFEALDAILTGKEYKVIYFTVPLEAVIDRNSGRLSCGVCGSVYHVKYNPPKSEGICDKCGDKLYQRKDDNAEVIRTRYNIYEETTRPLVELYEKRNALVKVDAQGAIGDVFVRLLRALGL